MQNVPQGDSANLTVVRQRAEMNPAEDQGKGDGNCEETASEQALMYPPAQPRAVRNEALRGQARDGERSDVAQVAHDTPLPVQFPAPASPSRNATVNRPE